MFALQTQCLTASWYLPLQKDRRSRLEEERLAGRLLLNVLAEACGIADRLTLELLEGEPVEESRTVAPQAWQDLLLGRVESVFGGTGRRTTEKLSFPVLLIHVMLDIDAWLPLPEIGCTSRRCGK